MQHKDYLINLLSTTYSPYKITLSHPIGLTCGSIANTQNALAWQGMLLDKLKDLQAGVFGFAISDEEYETFLIWALNNKNERLLSAILDATFSNRFNSIIKKVFVSAIKNNSSENATLLLDNSEFLKNNIRDFRGSITSYKHGSCGMTMLQLAALNGNRQLCRYLMDAIPGFHLENDYYGNNLLHFAAGHGDSSFYEFIKNLYPDWQNKKNLFGHIPDDYLPVNAKKLSRIEQAVFIDKFDKYSSLIPGAQSVKNHPGFCYGIAFVTALHVLRGKKALNDYYSILRVISNWDATATSLSNKVDNESLNKIGINTVKDAIEYVSSQYFYFYHVQVNKQSPIDMSRADRSQQLALVNMSKDKIISEFDYGIGDIPKQDFIELLKNNLGNFNTIISIGIGNKSSDILATEGHQIDIAINAKGEIYFCDPNCPYELVPVPPDQVDNLANIIYKYFDSIKSIEVYKYFPEMNVENKIESSPPSFKMNQKIFDSFLVSRRGHEIEMMANACKVDSPITLELIIGKLSTDPQSTKLSFLDFKNLINQALRSNSYRCLELLISNYTQSNNLTISKAFESLGIQDDEKRYTNYLNNKR